MSNSKLKVIIAEHLIDCKVYIDDDSKYQYRTGC